MYFVDSYSRPNQWVQFIVDLETTNMGRSVLVLGKIAFDATELTLYIYVASRLSRVHWGFIKLSSIVM